MKYLISVSALLLLSILPAPAQSAARTSLITPAAPVDLTCSPAPCRLPNVRVTQGNRTSHTAPDLAINPQNPSQLILGVEDSSCPSFGAAYSSNDGGSIWTRTCLPAIGIIDLISNTWMAYDNNGEVHALIGTFNEDCGENLILESHSTDNGVTWSSLNQILSVQFAVLDSQAIDNNSGSPFAGKLYGSSTEFLFNRVQIVVARSLDGGATWSGSIAATLPDTLGFNSEGFSHLAVGKDGTVYLGYMATPRSAASPNMMMITKSTDGGQTWTTPVQVFAATAVTDIPNTTVPALDAPVTDVDNSPAGNNRLYMTFYNWTGTFMQVLVTYSDDGGTTWTAPVPVAPVADTSDQFKPYLSVNSTGTLAVTWLDRRDDPANLQYRPYVALSKNVTFNVNRALAISESTVLLGTGQAVSAWQGSTLFVAWPDTRAAGVLNQAIGGVQQ